MADQIDANEVTEESSSPAEFDDGLVSTVEYSMPEHPKEDGEEGEVETDTDTDTISDDAEQNTSDGHEKDFHEHPRFKELIEEKNALKAKLAEIEQRVVPPEDSNEKPSYNNIMQMDDDAIVDEFTNNPKKFMANFAQQLFHEFSGQMTAKQKAMYEKHQQTVQQRTQEESLKNFFEKRPDGIKLLENGEIQRFLQSNPGYGPIAAYHELTREQAIQAEVDKARKAERDRVLKELKAKGHARSHAAAPSGNSLSTSRSPELKNPDKYGGRNNVLLDRMRRRMSGT